MRYIPSTAIIPRFPSETDPMIRKLVAIALLATLAGCGGSITAADDDANRGGGIATSGG